MTPTPDPRCQGCQVILVHKLSKAEGRCVECRGRMVRMWALRRRVYGKAGCPQKTLSRTEAVMVLR